MELNSIVSVRAHAEVGMGVALLSESAVSNELATGRLVRVDDARVPLQRTLYLLHNGSGRLQPAAKALRALLMED